MNAIITGQRKYQINNTYISPYVYVYMCFVLFYFTKSQTFIYNPVEKYYSVTIFLNVKIRRIFSRGGYSSR